MKKILFILIFMQFVYLYPFEIIGINDLEKGMRGHGYTVIEDRKIEQFNFEIISIINSSDTIPKMILAKLYGNTIYKAGGISEGMSGSPLYIDGKLIGALSYAIDYDTLNMGIVTPIEYIIKTERMMIKNENFIIENSKYIDEIKPGMSVSISPVRGDIYFENTGTLTYEKNGIFSALGHSFSNKGDIKFFLNASSVDYIVKNSKSPFKIGTVKETIGLVLQDRATGLLGVITENIEVNKIKVNVKKDNEIIRYNMEMVNDKNTIKFYLDKVIEAVLIKEIDAEDYKHMNYNFSLENSKGSFYEDKNCYTFLENNIHNFSSLISSNILNIINNPFYYINFETIVIDIELKKENKLAHIKNIKTNNIIYNPGSNIEFYVNYFVMQKGLKNQKIEIKIPRNFKVGNYIISISTGNKDDKDWHEYQNLLEYINNYKYKTKNNELSIRIKNEENEVKFSTNIPIEDYNFMKFEYEKDIIIDSFEAENDIYEYSTKKND